MHLKGGCFFMAVELTTSRRVTGIAVAVALLVWALFGMLDIGNRSFDGLYYDDSFVVTNVEEGGPADLAGLRVGDQIVSISGIPVANRSAVHRQPRTEIGGRRLFVVERADAGLGVASTTTVEIIYSGEPARYKIGLIGGGVIGLVFLSCCVLVCVKLQSTPALLFGITGLGLGAVLLPGPYLDSFGLRAFAEAVELLAFSVALACLLHFSLVFPKRKGFIERKGAMALIYGPAVLMATGGLVGVVGRPPGDVDAVIMSVLLILLLPYLILPILSIIHSYSKATRQERVEQGMNYLVPGIMVGLGPVAVELIVGLAAPGISLPGSDYYFLAFGLIPLSFTAALLRGGP